MDHSNACLNGRERNNAEKRMNKTVDSGFYLYMEIFHAPIEEIGKTSDLLSAGSGP